MTTNTILAITAIIAVLVFAFAWGRVVKYDRFQDWLKRIAKE